MPKPLFRQLLLSSDIVEIGNDALSNLLTNKNSLYIVIPKSSFKLPPQKIGRKYSFNNLTGPTSATSK